MRAPLSIVIPTLNAAPDLAARLPGLFEGLDAGLVRELILSDGGSSDDIAALAEGIGAVLLTGAPGRGGQLRRAADVAEGGWLLFLHADTTLPPGWAALVIAHIAGQGGPAAFRLAFDAGGMMARITAGWANLRTRLFGLPYGDQALLISREDYDAAGGYADIPLMEDVALARKLRRITLLPLAVTTSAARYQRDGWLRRGARNILTLLRYFAGVSPERLARRYVSSEN